MKTSLFAAFEEFLVFEEASAALDLKGGIDLLGLLLQIGQVPIYQFSQAQGPRRGL